jgi:hypothetical protein
LLLFPKLGVIDFRYFYFRSALFYSIGSKWVPAPVPSTGNLFTLK